VGEAACRRDHGDGSAPATDELEEDLMRTHVIKRAATTALAAATLAVGLATVSAVTTAAKAVSTPSDPGTLTLRLEAADVARAAADPVFAQTVCTSQLSLSAETPCAANVQLCAIDELPNRSPMLVTLTEAGTEPMCQQALPWSGRPAAG
jgi:hypothetical protein